MDTRQTWMTDYEYFGEDYSNNVLIANAKASYEVRKTGIDGKSGKIDGQTETFIAQNHTNPLNQTKYDKKLLVDISSNIRAGSIVEFDNKKWLVTSKIYDRQAYKVASVNECDHILNVYKNGVLSQVPACIENSVQLYRMGVDETRLVRVPEGVTVLRVQDNATTALIQRGEVFAIGRENYEVIDTNSVIEPGLLVLKMEFTTRSPEVIPDPKPVQDIVIEGAESILMGKSAVYTTDYEEPVVFTITGTFATITAQANNSCTVKAGDNFGEVTLTATAGEVSGTKKIKVTALF